MFTDKEFNYLKDHLSWELLAVKKYHMYADHMMDPGLKALAHDLGQKHQNRYQRLHDQMKRAEQQSFSAPH